MSSSIPENMSRNVPCYKSIASPVVKTRDIYCRVCGHAHGLTSAHIIPASEKEWFTLNDMMDYCHDSENEIDDIANQVGMRMDLHILGFDHGEFCIAIKTGRAVVHVLKADPIVRNELIPLYHNSPFDTDGLAIPFLYSRFAWSIFYKGMIRLRSHQQFLIADEGVLKSVRNYCLKILSPVSRALKPLPASKRAGKMPTFGDDDVEMEERDDEGHGNTLGEGSQSDDEDDISEGLEEQSSTITVTAEDEARWKVRFPFFYTENGIADPHEYEMVSVYPGMDKIAELKNGWRLTHPQIHLLANTAESPPA